MCAHAQSSPLAFACRDSRTPPTPMHSTHHEQLCLPLLASRTRLLLTPTRPPRPPRTLGVSPTPPPPTSHVHRRGSLPARRACGVAWVRVRVRVRARRACGARPLRGKHVRSAQCGGVARHAPLQRTTRSRGRRAPAPSGEGKGWAHHTQTWATCAWPSRQPRRRRSRKTY